jgi:ATP synthase protein I
MRFSSVAAHIGSKGRMVEDENGQGRISPQDARLTSLEERLKRAGKLEDERRPQIDSRAVIRSAGLRAAQSLVGMPFGGAVIGWVLDRLFDTAPWIMLALMFIGFAGGVIDVMKFSKGSPDQGSGK